MSSDIMIIAFTENFIRNDYKLEPGESIKFFHLTNIIGYLRASSFTLSSLFVFSLKFYIANILF
jgi:hypothetical protein